MIVISGIVQMVNIGMTIITNTPERRRRETLRVAEADRAAGGGLSVRDALDAPASRASDGPDERRTPRGWSPHPPERMLITPWIAGARRPARVLRRGVRGGVAADPHLRPAAVQRLGAARRARPRRGATSSPPTTASSATPATHARRTCARRSTSSTRRSRSRATSTAATSRPTSSAPSAPGPDLSQEAGWHPDDWQRAHFYDPRYVDPRSLMPPMKSLFSDKQVEQLIAFVQDAKRQVRSAALRGPALREARGAHQPGLPAAVHGLPGRAQADRPGEGRQAARRTSSRRRRTWRRSTAATGCRAIRCRSPSRTSCAARRSSCSAASAATASKGDGKGPGRAVHVAAARGLHRQGRRLLRRRHRARATSTTGSCADGPGRAMENFGERLSVDDIWRVVLFVKTIPNGTLDQEPGPRADRLHRRGSRRKELLAWVKSARSSRATRRSSRSRSPTRSCRRRCACSRASRPADRSGHQRDDRHRSASPTAAAGIRAIYNQPARTRAWADAAARAASKLPPDLAEGDPARQCRGSNEAPACSSLGARASARCSRSAAALAHDAPESNQSKWVMADWMMDTFFIFAGLALVGVPGRLEGRALPRPRAGGAHPAADPRGGLLHARLGARRGGVGRWPCRAVTRRRRRAYYHYLQAHQRAARQRRHVARRLDRRWPGCGASSSCSLLILLLVDPAVPHDAGSGPASARSTAGAATRPRRRGRRRVFFLFLTRRRSRVRSRVIVDRPPRLRGRSSDGGRAAVRRSTRRCTEAVVAGRPTGRRSTRRSRRSRATSRSTRAASGFDVFFRAEPDGAVRVHCYTTWDTPVPARGVPRARLHVRAAARRPRRRHRARAEPRHGEDVLMAERAVPGDGAARLRPARTATATSAPAGARHSRRAVYRAWVILAVMIVDLPRGGCSRSTSSSPACV